MDYIIDLFTNYVLMSAVFGWIVAQILKFFTGVFRIKEFSMTELFFGTGGMPSSHTAAVCALTCACAIKFGLGSYQVAISGVLAMIVMRDAMGMRGQVGEHAKALNIILKELAEAKNDPELTNKALGELAGHTPLQVFAGTLVGILVPIGMYFIPVFV
jgi:acid phosphatase family membrane protein YuiD